MSERSWRILLNSLTPFSFIILMIALASFVCGFSSPYVLPALNDVPIVGLVDMVNCTQLAHPLGGNNRSILSLGENSNALDLDLRLDKTTLRVGESIDIHLTFYNRDNGPIVLYFNTEVQPPISRNDRYSGLMFAIRPVGGAALVDQGGHPTPVIPFPNTMLRVLGSRTRCEYEYTIESLRLQQIGQLTPGEYVISAIYNNRNPGTRPADELNPSPGTPTPFPEYRTDQNVWEGTGISNEVRFTVTNQVPVVPAQ